jgi:hypothetical protein
VTETGGASAQMTFMPSGNILSNKFNVIIDKKVYPLYTHSFLYFGQDQFMKRIWRKECMCELNSDPNCKPCVKDGQPTGEEIQSACLLKGDSRKVSFNDIEVTANGKPDPEQCAKEVDSMFRPDYTCFTKPCSFAGVYQPPFENTKPFYGTSAIRYSVDALGLLEDGNKVTWPEVRKAADDFCTKDHPETVLTDKYAWMRCLTGIFVAKQFEHLQFSEDHQIEIAKFDTWTIGAVLYQLELMEILLPGA